MVFLTAVLQYVGYAATKDPVHNRQTDPARYLGKMVAMRFPAYAPKHDPQRFWIGRVEGKAHHF